MQDTIVALDASTTRPQNTMNDIDGVHGDIVLGRSRLQTSLSRIAILPPELIRHVIKLAVGTPENTRTILNLSHISVAWRNAVIDISELFTTCDWDIWHFELISIWLSRACQQPQSISLDYSTLEQLYIIQDDLLRIRHVSRLFDYEGQLWEKLQQALLNCDDLKIWGGRIPMAGFDSWFSSWVMPRLKSLTIESVSAGTITIPANAPALQNLVIEGWFPTFKGLSSITEMHCMPRPNPRWVGWVGMLNSLPRLERLRLACHYSPSPFDSMPAIHLPVLHTLELRNLSILELIKSFVVPNIKTLVLVSSELQGEESDQFWNNVVSCPLSTAVNYLRLVWSSRC